jgi:hypothetical protein
VLPRQGAGLGEESVQQQEYTLQSAKDMTSVPEEAETGESIIEWDAALDDMFGPAVSKI